jgi:hypothetical protein
MMRSGVQGASDNAPLLNQVAEDKEPEEFKMKELTDEHHDEVDELKRIFYTFLI